MKHAEFMKYIFTTTGAIGPCLSHFPTSQVDMKDPHTPLKNLTRICLLADLTLMLAWNPEEAAKIIENYKIYENKPPDRIMEKIENDPHQKVSF